MQRQLKLYFIAQIVFIVCIVRTSTGTTVGKAIGQAEMLAASIADGTSVGESRALAWHGDDAVQAAVATAWYL